MQHLHRTCRLVAISLVLAACHADTIEAPTSPSPLIVDPCPADPYALGCPPPPPPPPPQQQGLDIGYTWDSCKAPVVDLDRDGLDDECERRLGAAFAPDLVMNAFECNWDGQLNKMGGEYLYAVQYIVDPSGPRYRIVYMPGWYRDCGDVATGASGHGGDSEFIIVDVGFRALESWRSPTWQTLQVFLSAHCGAWNGRDCQWWDAGWWEREGRWVNGVRYGAPVVWVSNAKHANYYSKGKCFTGSVGADDCLNNGRTVRYPIQYAWQNVGSFTVPYAFESVPNDYAVTGIPARLGSSFTQPWAREHFWKTANADFRGWRGYDGSTPYGKTLRDIAHFFTDPIYTPPPPPPCPGPASITPGPTTAASLLIACPL